MSSLFLGQLQKIDSVVEDRRLHIHLAQKYINKLEADIEASQQHIRQLQIDIETQDEYRRKVLASKEFCESVLSQIRTALVMLHQLDDSEIIAFEREVRSQFRLNALSFVAEDVFVKINAGFANSRELTFTGIPTAPSHNLSVPKTDTMFSDLP